MEFWLPNLTSAEIRISDIVPTPQDIEALVSHLKKKRKVKREPPILKLLSAKCVIKNIRKFLTMDTIFNGHTNNPLAKLSADLVDYFIDLKFYKEPLRKSELLCFFLQLLTPQVTEYFRCNFKYFTKKAGPVVFRHMLQHCPKMQEIEVNEDVWANLTVLPRERPVDIFRLMAQQWPNLTYIQMRMVYSSFEEDSDTLLETISKYFPQINKLEICLVLETLTMKGVKFLSQLSKLKYLGVDLGSPQNENTSNNLKIIAHAAGELPSLERIEIFPGEFSNTAVDNFVEEYGRLYPSKKLTLAKLWLAAVDLDMVWPECLALEELTLKRHYRHPNFNKDVENYSNLLTGNCAPKKLTIKGIGLREIYLLVGKFGPAGLSDLNIYYGGTDDKPFDACKVLATCPNLQNIKFSCYPLVENSDFKIAPEYFANCERLKLNDSDDSVDCEPVMSELYRKYLLGSNKFVKKLKVHHKMSEFDDISWALNQEKHTCLDQVEEISISFVKSQDEDTSEDEAQKEEEKIQMNIENKAYRMILLLALRSPRMKKVTLSDYLSEISGPPQWFIDLFRNLKITLMLPQKLRQPDLKFDPSDDEPYKSSDDSWIDSNSDYYCI